MPARPVIVADAAIPFLRGRLEPFATVRYLPGAAVSREDVREADALLVRTRTRCDEALLSGSRVKFIGTATIGTDHIDLEYCRRRGIEVANAPGCNAPAVAQWVWSALLHAGVSPRGFRLGIVGLGHVGRIVAEWGRGLGAEILACDPPRQAEGDRSEDWLTLREVASVADALTVHVPFTRTGPHPTAGLISGEVMGLMRPGAFLLNASRGGITDERALLEILEKRPGGIRAVTDTWENEPRINRELLGKAIYATPHIAGYSLEGKKRGTRMALEALSRHFGLGVETGDLTGAYEPYSPSAESITGSYDIAADTERLRGEPEGFERLRNEYDYRTEPKRVLDK